MVAEMGLALAALVTLGLFLRSLNGLENTPAGFDHRNVTVCRLYLVTNNYTPAEEQQFSRRLRERLLAAPGVTGAAYSDSIPLGFGLGKWDEIKVEGYAPRPGENLDVHDASVSPGYFDLLSIPLLAGRDFRPEDNEKAPRVMIVNETFARRFFDGRDAVGRRVQIYGEPFTIVGTVKDSKYLSLSEAPHDTSICHSTRYTTGVGKPVWPSMPGPTAMHAVSSPYSAARCRPSIRTRPA